MKPYFEYSHFNLFSADRTQLKGHSWLPFSTPTCVLILVHDLGGHGLRYDDWAQELCKSNFGIFAVDLRGHGQSAGKQGDAKNLDVLLQDIDALRLHINTTKYKDLPLFIYGSSMGGLLATLYTHGFKAYLSGTILAAPWFKLSNPPAPIFNSLINLLVYLMPKYRVKTGVSSAKLRSKTNDQLIAKEDPYVHKRISLRLLHNINIVTKRLAKNIPQMEVPILALHGKADQVTSASQTKTFIDKQAGDAQLLLLNSAFHEIHLEDDNTKILHEINNWIKNHI
ncbi:alpha/beta fold hydrolase [Saccharicrinis aurantiacus]|uniref:alpha/beta fold hydrolase n=1 Tax=Saccharicrinis aurantiacus TaxID=1849719 RepID=UPI00248F7D0A|nr:alpha/beta fold hydrolase [Saccharicrinis aurantiacus]